MIRPDHPTLSIVRQCRLASIGRSTFYHVPKGRECEEPRTDGDDRPSVSGDAVLRRPADDVAPAGRRASGEHQAGSPPDAADGSDADLPAAADQRPPQGAQELSLPAARDGDRAAQPGVVRRTLRTSRWRRASCTWWRSWTGGAARSWRGGCPTPWTPSSASMRWMMRSAAMAVRRSSTPTRAASSRPGRGRNG